MITNVACAYSEESKKHGFLIKKKMLRIITITCFSMKDGSCSLTLSPLMKYTLMLSKRSSTGGVVREQSSL